MTTANIAEIFSSIQGEGLCVGERHLFVRFCGCNLDCAYCDARAARSVPKDCRVEKSPGSRAFVFRRNPLDLSGLMSIIADHLHNSAIHDAIAITGGEPLLHAHFLDQFLPLARKMLPRVLLETNGTLPDALRSVVQHIDIVSMDVKLRSSSGQPANYEANEKFLRIAMESNVFVKMVICKDTDEGEMRRAVELVASVGKDIPVVLQPVDPVGGVQPPSPVQTLKLQMVARRMLEFVRVIPQVHKLIGQL